MPYAVCRMPYAVCGMVFFLSAVLPFNIQAAKSDEEKLFDASTRALRCSGAKFDDVIDEYSDISLKCKKSCKTYSNKCKKIVKTQYPKFFEMQSPIKSICQGAAGVITSGELTDCGCMCFFVKEYWSS